MLRFLAAHAVPGVEVHDAAARQHTRLLPTGREPAVVTVRFPAPSAVGADSAPFTSTASYPSAIPVGVEKSHVRRRATAAATG